MDIEKHLKGCFLLFDKMVRKILVVKRQVLFSGDCFEGFVSCDEKDFMPMILGASEYLSRSSAEGDSSWKQMIPYIWLIDKKNKKIFLYRRAGGVNYREERLGNKLSCGIGGHVDKIADDSDNPIVSAMLRKLQEEVDLDVYPEPKIIGYINDEGDSVGREHFGVVGIAEVKCNVKLDGDDIVEGRWISLDEAEKLFDDNNSEVEGWTRMSWPYIKEYLKK